MKSRGTLRALAFTGTLPCAPADSGFNADPRHLGVLLFEPVYTFEPREPGIRPAVR